MGQVARRLSERAEEALGKRHELLIFEHAINRLAVVD